MTNNEVVSLLKSVDSLLNTMDKEHVKKLLITITGVHKEDTEFSINVRKVLRQVISDLCEMPNVNKYFTPKQIKKIYEIIGDYNCFPICQLCGAPIRINSETAKNRKQSWPTAFTWDHIRPKYYGGVKDLYNMQAAHKLCNNIKSNNIPDEQVHYKITIIINATVDGCAGAINVNPGKKAKKVKCNLRKQDSWCHKTRARGCCR